MKTRKPRRSTQAAPSWRIPTATGEATKPDREARTASFAFALARSSSVDRCLGDEIELREHEDAEGLRE
jgi:hypothetical protein